MTLVYSINANNIIFLNEEEPDDQFGCYESYV
jgi:hypothetical protein